MVDDINFPKGLPPVSAPDLVQRVNRKKGEEEKPPFEKFLNQEDPKEKEKKKKRSNPKSIADKIEIDGAPNYVESAGSTGDLEAEGDSEGKVIDVRV